MSQPNRPSRRKYRNKRFAKRHANCQPLSLCKVNPEHMHDQYLLIYLDAAKD